MHCTRPTPRSLATGQSDLVTEPKIDPWEAWSGTLPDEPFATAEEVQRLMDGDDDE